MGTVMLLQPSRLRDVGDDAALKAVMRSLDPLTVVAATSDPSHTWRATGCRSIPATPTAVLRVLPELDALVVLGGPLLTPDGEDNALGLGHMAMLLEVARLAGKQTALIYVSAARLRTSRDRMLARRIVVRSDLTVLADQQSASLLADCGVPQPMRVGADPAWLLIDDPPTEVPPGDTVRLVTTRADVKSAGGAAEAAGFLSAVLTAVGDRLGDDCRVGVQAWHTGSGAGEDLDAANTVADVLRGMRTPARVVPPPVSLSRSRDALGGSRLVVSAQTHVLMAAAAAGTAALAWPVDGPARSFAHGLAAQAIPAGAPVEHLRQSAAAALDAPGAGLSTVREQVAAAGEVLDLLRLLVTRGREVPASAAVPGRADARPGLRPRGVLR